MHTHMFMVVLLECIFFSFCVFATAVLELLFPRSSLPDTDTSCSWLWFLCPLTHFRFYNNYSIPNTASVLLRSSPVSAGLV